ncbi:unnamed protein product [Ilex paraguariensis]|uniref:Fcf2 pre-rRNA processing C-terminal domain-containing protein n=1 Tax=Ilex paraguariensis TaxID=185542 RepID=A0ABC8TKX6_9AQUA
MLNLRTQLYRVICFVELNGDWAHISWGVRLCKTAAKSSILQLETKGFTQPLYTERLWNEMLRSAIDPKRHYKKGDSKSRALPKYFQLGTVIESASEFFTGRLTKKERKATLADELLFDHTLAEYRYGRHLFSYKY